MAANPKRAALRNSAIARDRAIRIRDARTPMLATAEVIRSMIENAYAAESEPYGRPWKPLKYRTPPPPPLQLTGTSKASIRVNVGPRGDLKFWSAPYLYYHMMGKRSGVRKLPRRNPTPFAFDSGAWKAKPRLLKLHQKHIKQWVTKGHVTP